MACRSDAPVTAILRGGPSLCGRTQPVGFAARVGWLIVPRTLGFGYFSARPWHRGDVGFNR